MIDAQRTSDPREDAQDQREIPGLPDVDDVARRAWAALQRHVDSTTDYERLLARIQTSADRGAGECPDAHDSH